jgi:hypothetical protein
VEYIAFKGQSLVRADHQCAGVAARYILGLGFGQDQCHIVRIQAADGVLDSPFIDLCRFGIELQTRIFEQHLPEWARRSKHEARRHGSLLCRSRS